MNCILRPQARARRWPPLRSSPCADEKKVGVFWPPLSTGLFPPAFRDAPSLLISVAPRFLRRSEPLISVAAAWHRAVIKPWAAIGNQGLAASPRGDRCRGALAAGRGSRFSISMAPFRRERGACAGHGGSSTCLPLSAIMRRVAWYGTARAANRARPPSLLGHRRRGISRPLGLGQFILLCNVKLHVSHLIDEQ